jgi:hypothetical protein
MIVATCEKGAVEDIAIMRGIKARLDATKAANPNLVEMAAREVWRSRHPESVADPIPTGARAWSATARNRVALMKRRGELRIGIPRVLNMYAYTPLFSAYLESLGVRAENVVYSDFTTGDMYRAGSNRGSIDPCFPSKIAIAHVHNLVFSKHARQPLQAIFFPMFDVLMSPLVNDFGHTGDRGGGLHQGNRPLCRTRHSIRASAGRPFGPQAFCAADVPGVGAHPWPLGGGK